MEYWSVGVLLWLRAMTLCGGKPRPGLMGSDSLLGVILDKHLELNKKIEICEA